MSTEGTEVVFNALVAAYERGFAWANENVGGEEFVHKAARDYADLQTSPLNPDSILGEITSLRSENERMRRVVEAACGVVDADTYVHPILSREDAVAAGVAELHDAVNAWHSARPAAALSPSEGQNS